MFLVRIEVDSKKSSYTSFHGWSGSWPWIHITARISSFGEFFLAKKSSKGCQLSYPVSIMLWPLIWLSPRTVGSEVDVHVPRTFLHPIEVSLCASLRPWETGKVGNSMGQSGLSCLFLEPCMNLRFSIRTWTPFFSVWNITLRGPLSKIKPGLEFLGYQNHNWSPWICPTDYSNRYELLFYSKDLTLDPLGILSNFLCRNFINSSLNADS